MAESMTVVSAGAGLDYDWANDHLFVKAPMDLTDGRVTLVEDILKPGFDLARHHHRRMVEIFYILEGAVTFELDDRSVLATPGMTVTVPPGAWHHVTCPAGGRLLTIFSPGGFEQYLALLAVMSPADLADATMMERLSQRYDIWTE